MVANIALVLFSGIAGKSDLVSGRIPNSVTYTGVVAGWLIALASSDALVSESLVGTVVGFVSLFLFWSSGMMGGGDVKLSMMIGALRGPGFLIYFFFYVFSLCLAAFVYYGISRSGIVQTGMYMIRCVGSVFMGGRLPDLPAEIDGIRLPFGTFAFVAVCICLLLEWKQGFPLTPFAERL
jgi:Flp pilus assembly protein protease CpaA